MNQLDSLIAASRWTDALRYTKSHKVDAEYTSYIAQQCFLATDVQELTTSSINELWHSVTDKEWVASAALQVAKTSRQFQIVQESIKLGREATEAVIASMDDLTELVKSQDVEGVRELCSFDEGVRKVCLLEKNLVELGDKLLTWQEIWGSRSNASKSGANGRDTKPQIGPGIVADDLTKPNPNGESDAAQTSATGGIDIATFVSEPLSTTALDLAATARLQELAILCARHTDTLWPSRFDLLEAIPEWEDPSSLLPILPHADDTGREVKWSSKPWRNNPEFIERVFAAPQGDDLLGASDLGDVYRRRIEHIASMGLISVALAMVQHCTSVNVQGLEELGEELSLLSRLAYNGTARAGSVAIPLEDEELTLERWRELSPNQIVDMYLANATPNDVASAIRRLVLPYLAVLESGMERAGQTDTTMATRLLYDYILSLASSLPPKLDMLAAIFENSKPTLSTSTRIVKSNEDLARLAIASLYGCRSSDSASLALMSKIFECLPAFPESSAPALPRPPRTLLSLFPPHSTPPLPRELFAALQPFTPVALSAALDTVDLHLTTAEIFCRYSCPVPLSWMLLTHRDSKAQRAWATRMARTSASGGGGRAGNEDEFESEDEWVVLMEDMVALTEGKDKEDGLKKAFWLLDREEVLRIFFGGLLASGRTGLAKSLLQPSSAAAPLEPGIVQELVISASREFYDNAESGNIHEGDMKLAFETLSAAPQTPEIRKERDFIEATSRLCSYKVHAHPGVPLTPIEIRHSKDRLAFVARLLASNEEAYRHPGVILDLVAKLGYRGDKLAEIRTLAMISDSSLQAGEFGRTSEICDRIVQEVEDMRRAKELEKADESTPVTPSTPSRANAKGHNVLLEAAEFAWRSCFQLGKHEAFGDADRRMRALGQALILCPADKLSTLLPIWTSLEEQVLAQADAAREAAKKQKASTTAFSFASNLMASASSPTNTSLVATARPDSRQGHDTAAAAQRTFTRAAGAAASFFPFGSHQRASESSPSRSTGDQSDRERTHDQHGSAAVMPVSPPRGSGRTSADLFSGLGGREDGIRAGISSRLHRGVGWLIGADEELMRDSQENR